MTAPRDLKPQARSEVFIALMLAVACIIVGVAILVSGFTGYRYAFGAALALCILGLGWDWYAGPKPR